MPRAKDRVSWGGSGRLGGGRWGVQGRGLAMAPHLPLGEERGLWEPSSPECRPSPAAPGSRGPLGMLIPKSLPALAPEQPCSHSALPQAPCRVRGWLEEALTGGTLLHLPLDQVPGLSTCLQTTRLQLVPTMPKRATGKLSPCHPAQPPLLGPRLLGRRSGAGTQHAFRGVQHPVSPSPHKQEAESW